MAKKSKKAKRRAKPAARRKPGGSTKPKTIKTGRGPGPMEVGQNLVSMFNRGQLKEIEDKYWSPKIESIEGMGVSQAWRGRKAVEGKNAWWMGDHVMHGGSAEGPYVGATGFAVKFRLDVETKSTGKRETMEEVGVYTVQNGKIVREEFMYGTGGSAGDSGASETSLLPASL